MVKFKKYYSLISNNRGYLLNTQLIKLKLTCSFSKIFYIYLKKSVIKIIYLINGEPGSEN